jgi:hypothetical protein
MNKYLIYFIGRPSGSLGRHRNYEAIVAAKDAKITSVCEALHGVADSSVEAAKHYRAWARRWEPVSFRRFEVVELHAVKQIHDHDS